MLPISNPVVIRFICILRSVIRKSAGYRTLSLAAHSYIFLTQRCIIIIIAFKKINIASWYHIILHSCNI